MPFNYHIPSTSKHNIIIVKFYPVISIPRLMTKDANLSPKSYNNHFILLIHLQFISNNYIIPLKFKQPHDLVPKYFKSIYPNSFHNPHGTNNKTNDITQYCNNSINNYNLMSCYSIH